MNTPKTEILEGNINSKKMTIDSFTDFVSIQRRGLITQLPQKHTHAKKKHFLTTTSLRGGSIASYFKLNNEWSVEDVLYEIHEYNKKQKGTLLKTVLNLI